MNPTLGRATVLPTELRPVQGPPLAQDRLLIVTDPDLGSIPVWWRVQGTGRRSRWNCTVCGPQTAAACSHTFSAGLLLAEQLLGLSTGLPVPSPPSSHEENK